MSLTTSSAYDLSHLNLSHRTRVDPDKTHLNNIRSALEAGKIRTAAEIFADLGKETQKEAFDLLCEKFRDKCRHRNVVLDGVDLVFDEPLRLLAPVDELELHEYDKDGKQIKTSHPRIIDCLLFHNLLEVNTNISVFYPSHTNRNAEPATRQTTHSSQQKSPNELFLDFYKGIGPNNNGVYFDNILDWNDDKLEKEDLCIPWLFPDEDDDDDNAPVFNNDVVLVEIFRKGETMCRLNLTKAYYRILRFYGLEHKEIDGGIAVRIPGHKLDWLQRPHNFKRISRILESLSTLGDNIAISEFVTILEDIAKNEGKGKIPIESLKWWRTLARYG
jgi:hypothetical protein